MRGCTLCKPSCVVYFKSMPPPIPTSITKSMLDIQSRNLFADFLHRRRIKCEDVNFRLQMLTPFCLFIVLHHPIPTIHHHGQNISYESTRCTGEAKSCSCEKSRSRDPRAGLTTPANQHLQHLHTVVSYIVDYG